MTCFQILKATDDKFASNLGRLSMCADTRVFNSSEWAGQHAPYALARQNQPCKLIWGGVIGAGAGRGPDFTELSLR